jgi:hypothetical protein
MAITQYTVEASPNTPYFTPTQKIPVGTATNPQPNGKPIPKLFQPLKIRGLEFQNRVWLSPLGQASSENGKFTPWHIALGKCYLASHALNVEREFKKKAH